MLGRSYQILIIYSILLIISVMHSRYMKINLLKLHSLKNIKYTLKYSLVLILLSIIALFLNSGSSNPSIFPNYLNIGIVIFASYTQVLFIFGILQNKLQEYLGYDSVIFIAAITSILAITSVNLHLILTAFLLNLAFSHAFFKTRNLIIIAIPEIILT